MLHTAICRRRRYAIMPLIDIAAAAICCYAIVTRCYVRHQCLDAAAPPAPCRYAGLYTLMRRAILLFCFANIAGVVSYYYFRRHAAAPLCHFFISAIYFMLFSCRHADVFAMLLLFCLLIRRRYAIDICHYYYYALFRQRAYFATLRHADVFSCH